MLKEKAAWVRWETLEAAVKAGSGHLGGSFSCADILVTLYYGGNIRRGIDRFILSKGHACLPLYVILADLGYFSKDELGMFCQPGALLQGHPTRQIPGIEVDSGSLGHGLGLGAGMALAKQLKGEDGYIYVLLGDGECYEGSVWEVVQFAWRHKLRNLIAIVDQNGLGATDKVECLKDDWRGIGWEVAEMEGNDIEDMRDEIAGRVLYQGRRKPLAILAHTIKGKGVSYMEGKVEWHHGVPHGAELEQARKELGYTGCVL